MVDLTIRQLIDRVTQGDIRIPAFQRDFVWEPDQVAFLIDSIYKNFPIGTVIFWQTDERLKIEKDLGAFSLPEPKRDYPVNYVLDGQQRITSLFSTFQTDLSPTSNEWLPIYFDMDAADNVQDVTFYALQDEEVDTERHFPVATFFDTTAYRRATIGLSDNRAELIDRAQTRFKEYRVQNQIFETTDRTQVAIVFERINRSGTELNMFELLAAWSWSDDFDLIEKFDDLQQKIADKGFQDLTEDRDLQLRICAGTITGETRPSKILDLQGDDIRNRFREIESGILGAIDFLSRELGVKHYKMLPYPGILVPLSAFFATDKADGVNYSDIQKEKLERWFWRSVFMRRFSSDVTERQAADIGQLKALRNDEGHELRMPAFENKIDFRTNRFSAGTANSKALILMLCQKKPHSFLSGSAIDLDKVLKKGSRHEFHHIFPRKHLEREGVDSKYANVLSNICFLTKADNNKIRDKSPSEYFKKISSRRRKRYLSEALCKPKDRRLSYETFVETRAKRLEAFANKLAGFDPT